MGKLSRLAGLLVCSASLAATGIAASAGVVHFGPQPIHLQPLQGAKYIGNGWWNDNGVVYHTPHYMMTRQQAAHMHVHPNGVLTYGGGPVLTNPVVYQVFWGYGANGDPNHVKPLITKFLKNVGGSLLENNLTQYYGPGHVHIVNHLHWLKGTWIDNVNPIPASPTDAQVAAEATRLMMHFGGANHAQASYVVNTAHGHSISGFGSSFCAYHSAVSTSVGVIAYHNEPYMPDAGGNCGAGFIAPPSDETSADEGVTIVEGHELNESVTDPQPFSGWNSGSGEIGDLCAWTNIQNDPFGTFSYTSQPEYDNQTSGCTHNGP